MHKATRVAAKFEVGGATEDFSKKAHRLRRAGQWSALAEHLAELDHADEGPDLRILRAEAALRTGDAHEAVAILDALLEREDGRLPPNLRASALLVRSTAARIRGFGQKALEDASAATAILEGQTSPPDLLIQGHKQIGIILGMGGELDSAIDHFERALRLCARSSDLGLQAEVQNATGFACYRLGRYAEAHVHYQNAAAAYKKLRRRAELSDLYINLGVMAFDQGDLELALETNTQALEIAASEGYKRSVSMALINIGDVHQALGRSNEALDSYQKALDSGADALEPRLFCCANTGLATVYRSLKEPSKSRFYAGQAAFEAKRLNLKHEHAMASFVDGELAQDEGDHARAKLALEFSATTFQQIGSLRQLVRTQLRLAQVYKATRRWKLLTEILEELARVVRQLESDDYLVREARNAQDVIAYAASKRIGGTLFSSVRSRVAAGAGRVSTTPDARHPQRHDSTNGMPVVTVRALGELQIFVEGRNVGGVEWESQKAQELFVFLCCHRTGKSREELIEVLWPDVSIGLSRNALHSNVYRTRRALYRESIVLESGRYRLNPGGTFEFDVDEMKRLLRVADESGGRPEQQVRLLTDAIKLYRGELLLGFHADWITPLRMEAEGLYLGSLNRLARVYESLGKLAPAVAALDRILAVDPTAIEIHEAIIDLLKRAGNVAEARNRRHSMARLIKSELRDAI